MAYVYPHIFTGISELDVQIFSYLDLSSLNKVSQCSKPAHNIFNNTTLWKELVDRDFGVSKYKPKYETYQQQYKYLQQGDPLYYRTTGETSGAGWWDTGKYSWEHRRIRAAIRESHLDLLKMLLEQGVRPDQEIVDQAASMQLYQVLIMLYSYEVLPSQKGINQMQRLITSEIFDIEDKFMQELKEADQPLPPTLEQNLINLPKMGAPELILQMYRKKGLIPDSEEVILAARQGDLDKLEALTAQGYHPRQEAATAAASHGHLNVLEWIYDNTNSQVLPSQDGFNTAVENVHLEVIAWLEAKGMTPNEQTAEIIITVGNLHLLEWVVSRGVELTQRMANIAALEGQINILRWMSARPQPVLPQRSYVPSMRNQTNRHRIIEMVDWMVEKGIMTNDFATNYYMTCDSYCVNTWYTKRKVVPNSEGATYAARHGHTDVLMWLKDKGVMPDKDSIDVAVRNGHYVTVKYLYEEGYRPSQKAVDLCVYFAPRAWKDKRMIPPSLKIARWLAKQDPPIKPQLEAVADDIRHEPYPEFLGEWLVKNGVIDEFPTGARPEESNWNPLNMDYMDWDDSFPYKICQYIVDDLAIQGHLELLEHLAEEDWIPSWECLDAVEDSEVRKFIQEQYTELAQVC